MSTQIDFFLDRVLVTRDDQQAYKKRRKTLKYDDHDHDEMIQKVNH